MITSRERESESCFWRSFSCSFYGLESDTFKSWSLNFQQALMAVFLRLLEAKDKVPWEEQKFPALHVFFLLNV